MDGYVHHDDMCDALKRLGFVTPLQEWVDEAMAQVTFYSTLTPAEFVLFISAYEDRVRAACAKEFAKYDADTSGVLDTSEFSALLRDMGIEPMSHVLEEVIGEVDRDLSGHLDFEEFFEVMRLIQEREGFSRSEFQLFMEVFQTFDRDKTAEMDAQELVQVLLYLGYQCTPEDALSVVHEVDFDGSGSMDLHEFVVCMRKIREREVRALKAAMLQHDVDASGTIGIHELMLMVHSVGYFPDDTVVDEVLEEIGVEKASAELTLSMLWRFLVIFRQREGLSRADAAEVDQGFERYATGTEVSAIHIPKIVRYMGYSLSHEEQQRLVSQVDIDGSGSLGVFELRKLVRICREQRSKLMQAVFKKYMDQSTELIAMQVVPEALRSIGAVTDGRPPPEIPPDDDSPVHSGLRLEAFMRLARRQFAELEQEVRMNGGYSLEEVVLMRRNFELYDADNSGEIKNSELVALVTTVFPDMAADQRLRPRLMEIIREADRDGSGSLDFEDFLRLMRTVCDLRYRNQLDKERQAVQDTGFLPQEVHDFRELFRAQAGGTMHLSLEGFREMINPICPLGDRNASVLNAMWCDAISTYGKEGQLSTPPDTFAEWDTRQEVDFAEFLWLMRRILDTNFGNVLQRTKKRASLAGEPSPARAELRDAQQAH